MNKTIVIAGLAITGLVTGANAQSWSEVADGGGDAGALAGSAQAVVGAGALTSISGSTSAGLADFQDLYLINIVSPASFQASVHGVFGGSASFDTQLFLFSAAGMGIQSNDDTLGQPGTLSTLGGPITLGVGPGITGSPAGLYVLAITGFNAEAQSAGGAIFPDAGTPFTQQVAPSGPGGGSPLSGWSVGGATGTYSIALVGAEYVPGPAGLALLGIAGVASRRRRRN